MKLRWITGLGCALALAGCDQLADEHTRGSALAKMKGTLTLAQGMDPPEGDLHISILWQKFEISEETEAVCGENEVRGLHFETPLFEQRLELDTDFPAAFSVELSEPPPSGALTPTRFEPDVDYAEGKLVVYRDVNHNGRLDQRGFSDSSPDEVLGSSEGTTMTGRDQRASYRIIYLSQDLANTNELLVDRRATT